MPFSGIPLEAVDFYRELSVNNTREWWLANKPRYEELVKQPFLELAELVTPAFGEPKIYRPHRDVRFSHDKSPYKTHQGLYVHSSSFTGWYLQVDSTGFLLAGGSYFWAGDQLARYRAAVTNDATGVQLEEILRELTEAGYVLGGEKLATRPRGTSADAPRLELLRHKALSADLTLGEPEWMATPEAAEYVNDGWDELRPLMSWLHDFVGETETSRG
ncbi:MAG: DUF2461 domain-containing protein [Luteococcus sp.]|uniref:DUF2461 domain-containing protein n=1 Tax=Luteococcus sp. TaxID=1969402 RepID=UPI002648224D|nr:DUF2461 domain-containing protein [Luteococcus sp.]MDN5562585.1 DUF2461 domain-containing protein [Luteococcus sp.]